MTIARFRMTPKAIEELIAQNGNHKGGGNNRNENPNENSRGAMPVACVCSYQDFMKCQPLNFKGTEGVVGLTRWYEKMETVFHINNCPEVYQVNNPTIPSLVPNLLTVSTPYRTQPFMVQHALVAVGEKPNIPFSFVASSCASSGYILPTSIFPLEWWLLSTMRSQNHRNQTRNKTGNKTEGNEVTTKAYTVGEGGTNPDSSIVTGTFLLNNCYASMLFDLGADRSFMFTTFSALLDVAPSTLDTSYAVELANGRVS
nr:reverse transcriptase domain-containing protein [Tanacetum cinerariifolium]